MQLLYTPDSPQDLAAAVLLLALPFLSAASAAFVLFLRLHTRRSRRLTGVVTPLWPVRFLLSLFAALWSLVELLRLPSVRSALPLNVQSHPGLFCRAQLFASQAFLEPASLALILFLIRASTRQQPKSNSASSTCKTFFQALASCLLVALSILLLHLFFDKVGDLVLSRFGYGQEVVADAGYWVQDIAPSASASAACSNPIYSTALLGALATLYVPLFISVSWEAASIAINKRLVARLYTLSAVVVASFAIQSAVVAVSTIWNFSDPEFKWLSLANAAATFTLVGASQWTLVFQPTLEAFFVGRAVEKLENCRRTCTVSRELEHGGGGGGGGGAGGLEVVVVTRS